MAHVGVSAAGNGAKNANRARSTVETTTQKKMPTAKHPDRESGSPTLNDVVAAISTLRPSAEDSRRETPPVSARRCARRPESTRRTRRPRRSRRRTITSPADGHETVQVSPDEHADDRHQRGDRPLRRMPQLLRESLGTPGAATQMRHDQPEPRDDHSSPDHLPDRSRRRPEDGRPLSRSLASPARPNAIASVFSGIRCAPGVRGVLRRCDGSSRLSSSRRLRSGRGHPVSRGPTGQRPRRSATEGTAAGASWSPDIRARPRRLRLVSGAGDQRRCIRVTRRSLSPEGPNASAMRLQLLIVDVSHTVDDERVEPAHPESMSRGFERSQDRVIFEAVQLSDAVAARCRLSWSRCAATFLPEHPVLRFRTPIRGAAPRRASA